MNTYTENFLARGTVQEVTEMFLEDMVELGILTGEQEYTIETVAEANGKVFLQCTYQAEEE